jgi:hypothetical protein
VLPALAGFAIFARSIRVAPESCRRTYAPSIFSRSPAGSAFHTKSNTEGKPDVPPNFVDQENGNRSLHGIHRCTSVGFPPDTLV